MGTEGQFLIVSVWLSLSFLPVVLLLTVESHCDRHELVAMWLLRDYNLRERYSVQKRKANTACVGVHAGMTCPWLAQQPGCPCSAQGPILQLQRGPRQRAGYPCTQQLWLQAGWQGPGRLQALQQPHGPALPAPLTQLPWLPHCPGLALAAPLCSQRAHYKKKLQHTLLVGPEHSRQEYSSVSNRPHPCMWPMIALPRGQCL